MIKNLTEYNKGVRALIKVSEAVRSFNPQAKRHNPVFDRLITKRDNLSKELEFFISHFESSENQREFSADNPNRRQGATCELSRSQPGYRQTQSKNDCFRPSPGVFGCKTENKAGLGQFRPAAISFSREYQNLSPAR
jgi:hypothetical protein